MSESLLATWLPNVDWQEIGYASLDTLNMLGGSLLFTVLLGLPLGVLLFLTGPRQLFEQRPCPAFCRCWSTGCRRCRSWSCSS